MSWFKRDKKSIDQVTPPEERRVRTEGLWMKCESCRAIVFRKDLEENLLVCPKCQFHFKMNSKQRQKLFAAMKLDKKVSGGEVKFVLAEKIGRVKFDCKVAPPAISRAI